MLGVQGRTSDRDVNQKKALNHDKHCLGVIRTALVTIALASSAMESSADPSTTVLKSINIEGRWISATDPHRKCGSTEADDWDADPWAPDISFRWDGDQLIQTGWESSTSYTVKSSEIDGGTSYRFSLNFIGAGEGEEWSGRSTWCITSDANDKPSAKSLIKVEIIDAGEEYSPSDESSATYAADYIRCLE